MQNTKAHAPSTLYNTKTMDIEQNLVHGEFRTKNVFVVHFFGHNHVLHFHWHHQFYPNLGFFSCIFFKNYK
jgi:hypothetical protein